MGRIWASGPYPLRPGWPLRFWPAPTVRSGLPGQERHHASSRFEGGPVKTTSVLFASDGQPFDQLSVCTWSLVVIERLLLEHVYAPLPGEYELW